MLLMVGDFTAEVTLTTNSSGGEMQSTATQLSGSQTSAATLEATNEAHHLGESAVIAVYWLIKGELKF